MQLGDSGKESSVTSFYMYLLSRQTGLLGVWLLFFLSSPETLGALLHINTLGSLVQRKEILDRQTTGASNADGNSPDTGLKL